MRNQRSFSIEFIARCKDFLSSIRQGCRLMNIPRSSFYRKPGAEISDRMKLEADLVDRIEVICVEFPRYGYRRVNHHFPNYPNLIKGMVINRLNQVWISDITYIRIKAAFVYLTAILDACSRRVIGYALSTRIDSSLTIEAFKMAIAERNPGPGIIHHSDQGVQYASSEYVDELKSYGFEISMAQKGNPYENARMELFQNIEA